MNVGVFWGMGSFVYLCGMMRAILLTILSGIFGLLPADAGIWKCDFNDGATAWQFPTSGKTVWRCVRGAGYMDFTGIDPDDTGSLSVEGTQSPADRETSCAMSPLIKFEGASVVSFYVGWSSAADPTASLELLITDASGRDSDVLWSTLKAHAGDGKWAWRRQSVKLPTGSAGNYRLKFRYTSGTLDAAFGIGGYRARFMIDNIEVSAGSSTPGTDPEPKPEPLRLNPGSSLRTASQSQLFVPPMTPVVMSCTGGPENVRPTWSIHGATGAADRVTPSADGRSATFVFASEGERTVSVSTGKESVEATVYAGWRSIVSLCPSGAFGATYTPGSGAFAIIQEYGAPPAPVAIDRVDVWLASLEAQPGATVKVEIDGTRNGASVVNLDGYRTHDDEGRVIPLSVSFATPVVAERSFRITVSGGADVRLEAACDPSDAGGAYARVGTEWKELEGRSLRINPHCAYSTITRLWPAGTDDIEIPAEGGTVRMGVFSHLSLSGTSSQSWCALTEESESNGEHVLAATCRPIPAGLPMRRAEIRLTDGASCLTIGILQKGRSGIDNPQEYGVPYSVSGRTVTLSAASRLRVLNADGSDTGLSSGQSLTLPTGIYIITGTTESGAPYAAKLRL